MILTISTTHQPATDLGYLLHKHPDKFQSFPLAYGQAHVFFPEAHDKKCTAALLLDINPITLVRGRKKTKSEDTLLDQYVNDRPYVASSFLSSAISKVYRTARSGQCREKPGLVNKAIPLSAKISSLPCRGGENFVRKLFAPLGYDVQAYLHPLDNDNPQWGPSLYYTVELKAEITLKDLLTHLYILIPVLDDDKHYYIGEDEVEKLLKFGEGWLKDHPQQDIITRRYLIHRPRLTRLAISRLLDDDFDPDRMDQEHQQEEEILENPLSLNEQRISKVVSILKKLNVKRVIDLGCGEGKLLKKLVEDSRLTDITGFDVSYRFLEKLKKRLKLDLLPDRIRSRIHLLHGSLTYRDSRIAGFDAAAVIEVIEHLDQARLRAFERVLFEFARPNYIILTTPNVEYNIRFDQLSADKLRHRDHRFEWTRSEFQTWANNMSSQYNYSVRFLAVGEDDPKLGPPCQLALFTIASFINE